MPSIGWPPSALNPHSIGRPGAIRPSLTNWAKLGTLGGGNHFLEVQADEDDNVWIMLHSGSRALGKQVCDHFYAIARAGGR